MELYEYKGRNKHGDVMTGTIESASPDAVADWLLGSGIAPVSIQVRRDAPSSQPEWLTRIREYGMLGLRDRLLFTRQMTTMVRARDRVDRDEFLHLHPPRKRSFIQSAENVGADLERGGLRLEDRDSDGARGLNLHDIPFALAQNSGR